MYLHIHPENGRQSLDCIPKEQEQLLCPLSAIHIMDLSKFCSCTHAVESFLLDTA